MSKPQPQASGQAAAAGSGQSGEVIFGDNDDVDFDDSILERALGGSGSGESDDDDDDAGEEDEDGDPDTTPADDDDDDDDAEDGNPSSDDDDELELPDDDDGEEEDEETDEDEEEGKELRLPEKFRQRLDKAKKQRDEARAEAKTIREETERLKKQVEAFESEPVMLQPTADSPLTNVRNSSELEQTEKQWQGLLDWAEDNEDGGTLKLAGGGTEELTKEQVRALRKQARAMLEKHVPARREYLAKRPKAVESAKKAYPWLTKPDHPGAKFAVELITGTGLTRRPDYELKAADAYVGALIRSGKATAVLDPKTGQVKLIAAARRPAAEAAAAGKGKKPPVRAEAGAVPLRAAGGKGQKDGAIAAALARGDGEKAALALFGGD